MAAILLDFKKPLLYLDDSIVHEPRATEADDLVPAYLNKVLGTNLSQSKAGGMKAFHWAIDLYKEGHITLDKVDRDNLKKYITEMDINLLVQGRLIEVIEQAEEEDAKPKPPEAKVELKPKSKELLSKAE